MTDSVGEKLEALVPVPAAVLTEIFPALAPFGTIAVICDADTTENAAGSAPNFTALAPLKYDPETVT